MPRYFFHVYDNGTLSRDEIGAELPDVHAARQEAIHALPEIAYERIPLDGDRQSFVVVAKDENDQPVYSATLSYTGLWLNQ